MFAQNGMPTVGDMLILLDGWGAWVKRVVTPHGLGQASESGVPSLAYLARQAQTAVFGDGNAILGLDNIPLRSSLASDYAAWRVASRYDVYTGQALRSPVSKLETNINNSLPSYYDSSGNVRGWTFSGGAIHATDALLTRLNATGPNTPAKPAAPTLTAIAGGALAATSAGNAPRVVMTQVGLYDHWESLPSGEAVQVALAGANGGYQVGNLPATVPAGVYKFRFYRGVPGGAAGVYYYAKDVVVTPGQPSPVVTLLEADITLRTEIGPPAWASCLALPEDGLGFACAFGSLSQADAGKDGPMSFTSNGLLSPSNMALGPVSGLLGYNNPAGSGTFATWLAGAFAAGTILTSSDYRNGLQGFLGAAGGVQARTTATLDANASLTNVNYTYLAPATGTTPQAGTIAGPVVLPPVAGSTVSLGIPAGRIVTAITAATVGGATTGGFLFEAMALRTI